MKFSIFFHLTCFLLSIITVSMNPICENDNICTMLVFKPRNPNSEAPSPRLGHVHNLRKFLISLTSFKALVRGSIPTLLILNFLEKCFC